MRPISFLLIFLAYGPAHAQFSDDFPKDGKFAETLAEALKTRETVVKAQGADSAQALTAAHRVASLQLLLDQYGEAETTLHAAVVMSMKADPTLQARLRNDLGVAYYRLARYEKAKGSFAEAFRQRKEALGAKHPDTLQSLRNLAWAEEGLGNADDGRALLKQCYDGLAEIANDPNLKATTSAEAVVFVQRKPSYPRIEILAGTYAPGPPPPPKFTPAKDLSAWIQTLDRLAVMQKSLGIKEPKYGLEARKQAIAVWSVKDYRTWIVAANFEYFPLPASAPAPLGKDSLGHAELLMRGALLENLKLKSGESQPIRPLAVEAHQIRSKLLGADNPHTADTEEFLGILDLKDGKVEESLALLRGVLGKREKAHGKRHADVGYACGVLGVIHYHRGEVTESRRYLDRAVLLLAGKLGASHPDAASTRGDLAVVLRQQGDYASARVILEQSYETLLKALGTKHFQTRTAGNNLAVLRVELGDYAGAARYFNEVLESDASDYDKEKALLNLAAVTRLQGDVKSAIQLYQKPLAKNPNDPHLLNLVGACYRDLGELGEAEKHLKQALDIRLKGTHADRQPTVAFTMTSLGLLYQAQGKHAEAAKHFAAARDIYRKQQGPISRQGAELSAMLGQARLQSGDLPGAKQALLEALDVKDRWSRDQLPMLAEADALRFLASVTELDPLLATLKHLGEDVTPETFTALWKARGLATRALTARRQASADTPEAQSALLRLHAARKRLAEFLSAREDPSKARVLVEPGDYKDPKDVPSYETTRAKFEQKIVELNEEKERCERELAGLSAGFLREQKRFAATPADLVGLLPADVAVVEFVRLKSWTKLADGSYQPGAGARYEAFLLRVVAGKLELHRVDLGPADAIDSAVADWREMFAQAGKQPRGARRVDLPPLRDPKLAPPDQFLRQHVWEPVARKLPGIKTAVVIPDGALARLPFAALPGAKPGTFLLEEFAIVNASFGQQVLATLTQTLPAGKQTLLVGGVTYDDATPQVSAGHRGAEGVTRKGWGFLPGAEREIEEIAKLRKDVRQLTGKSADKAGFAQALPGGRYVHIATHGFFADPDARSALTSALPPASYVEGVGLAMPKTPAVLPALVGRNPLVLTGLVLAGANQGSGGLLTGEEIVDLPLGDAELVVLSACETGLGTTAGGEGIFGLQRAFHLAGARTTIASLWQVDDDATQALMVEVYRNLWQRGLTKAEALRQAQIAALHGKLHQPPGNGGGALSPYFWAAFVMSGDWR